MANFILHIQTQLPGLGEEEASLPAGTKLETASRVSPHIVTVMLPSRCTYGHCKKTRIQNLWVQNRSIPIFNIAKRSLLYKGIPEELTEIESSSAAFK